MDIKKLLPIILVTLSCSSFASDIGEGFVQRNAEGETYLYTTQTIKKNEKILVQYPKENGDIGCCKVTSSDGKLLPQGEVTDELNGSDVHVYKLKLRYTKPFVGIAVIGAGASVTGSATGLEIKNRNTSVKTCLSQEGVHLFSTKTGDLKTHLYLPLGYDVEPTCDSPGK
ncbi:hypothetical protein [Collimonas humicola]|uniref:hypothetical protein n=1 Tax=Collimonas humicola TaxID=2825886 RepID=UPI001B8D8886|nr:hypothetical protein [Collimonas humicola]